MEYITLGKTGLKVSRLGFGGIPIQRVDAATTKELVKDMYFSISASHVSKQLLGVVSYNDRINFTFTRNFVENDFERAFIRELTDNGVKLTVQSNYWEKKL